MLRTETGATPLHTAAGTANIDVVNVLLSAPGVNVNSKNEKSKTPFDVACSNRKVQDLLARFGGRPCLRANLRRAPVSENVYQKPG